MRLRQICLVANDIATPEDHLTGVFGLEVGERDAGVEQWGLYNFLLPIGGDFLEVVAPSRGGTAAGRLLQRRGGDGGYMAIFQCDDGLACRERITGLGVRLIWSRSAREDYIPSQYHPRDCHGTILAVGEVPGADRHDDMCSWPPARDHWRPHVRREVTQAMVAGELQSADPRASAELWSAMLGTPVQEVGSGRYTLAFDNAVMRFVEATDGRGDGLSGIDLRINDMEHVLREAHARKLTVMDNQVTICGVRINLV